MTNLFKKAAVFSDIHFGKKSDSERHNQDCLEFIDWFCENTSSHGCDTIIFMGDWFDNRSRLRHDTNWFSNVAIEKLVATGCKIYWVIGNHDLYFKASREIHSLPSLEKYSDNIHVINDPMEIDGCLLCPWLVGSEFTTPPNHKVKYVFGHFEFPLFLMNETVECMDRGGIHMDHFYQCDQVFSGHFHKRQTKINEHGIPITYVGNPFAHDFNDVGDTDRGCMILEWGEEPEYLNWDAGPRFIRMKLSELVEHIDNESMDTIINEKTIVKCRDDLNIDLNEVLEIKEALQGVMRDINIETSDDTVDIDTDTDIDGDDLTVEQLVLQHLDELDTEGSDYETPLLKDIFTRSGEE